MELIIRSRFDRVFLWFFINIHANVEIIIIIEDGIWKLNSRILKNQRNWDTMELIMEIL